MTIKSQLTKARFHLDHAIASVDEESENLRAATNRRNELKQAVEVVQTVAQAVEQAVHKRIANVVTDCLEAVFGEEAYQFVIRFDRKRNRTEAQLSFLRDGLEIDPMTAAGGGAVDVAAFGLRVACLTLMRDVEQVLILDEPWKFLSKQYHYRMRDLMTQLSSKLGTQFIIVTHIEALKTGKVIELQ